MTFDSNNYGKKLLLFDDYINENSNPKRRPRLIVTDLYSRIINNEKCDILIKRLDEVILHFLIFVS